MREDVAIFFDRAKKFEVFGHRLRCKSDVFEVHVMDERMWEFYKRFIDKWIEIK